MSRHTAAHEFKPFEERVAVRAYARWERRGRPVDDSLEDWLAARAEVEAEQDREAYERQVALYE
jgi:hypothetical protein